MSILESASAEALADPLMWQISVTSELGHEIQVPGLSGRMTVVVGLEGEGEWPMICHHEKVSALHEMRMARYTAKSSVLYLVSASCSFLEK